MNSFNYIFLFILFYLIQCVSTFAQSKSLSADSLNAQADTLITSKTNSSIVNNDTLVVLKNRFSKSNVPFTTKSKKEMELNDYRYMGDFVNQYPTTVKNALGNLGQPHQLLLYGLGNSNISVLQDGVMLNTIYNNSYDLNYSESEYLDSIEVMPLYKGFLYNSLNNPVAINYSTRDSLSTIPFSRLKFYQASNQEEYVDVIFNAQVHKRVNISFQLTNQKVDSRYLNSEFYSWKANGKIRYLLSSKINIVGSYNYSTMYQGLNGGVDFEKIKTEYPESSYNDILYDETKAPVIYGIDAYRESLRYQKHTLHNYNVSLIGNFIKSNPTIFSITFQNQLTQFRQNEKGRSSSLPVITNNNEAKNLAIDFNQIIRFNNTEIELLLNHTNSRIELEQFKLNKNYNSTSFALSAEYHLFNGLLSPEIFYKYSSFDKNIFSGYGGQVILRPINNITGFIGYSKTDKPYDIIESIFIDGSEQRASLFEAGVAYKSNNTNAKVAYYSSRINNSPLPYIYNYTDTLTINEIGGYTTFDKNVKGTYLSLIQNFGKFQLDVNLNYFQENNLEGGNAHPLLSAKGGIYYIDTLFNRNLRLKTGINFNYFGGQDYFVNDYQSARSVKYISQPSSNSLSRINNFITESGYQIDLYLSGKIQNAAIVYLIFENVTGSNYYIVPYYPMRSSGFRIGLSWEFLD